MTKDLEIIEKYKNNIKVLINRFIKLNLGKYDFKNSKDKTQVFVDFKKFINQISLTKEIIEAVINIIIKNGIDFDKLLESINEEIQNNTFDIEETNLIKNKTELYQYIIENVKPYTFYNTTVMDLLLPWDEIGYKILDLNEEFFDFFNPLFEYVFDSDHLT
ncbi:MAG: hypothetical protein IKT40_11875 [Bacilli bacterium]|nr:hypothetical protein [Bacilli bacterium]